MQMESLLCRNHDFIIKNYNFDNIYETAPVRFNFDDFYTKLKSMK